MNGPPRARRPARGPGRQAGRQAVPQPTRVHGLTRAHSHTFRRRLHTGHERARPPHNLTMNLTDTLGVRCGHQAPLRTDIHP